MSNPNPPLENLTRAGMGQPLKGLQRTVINLSPDLLEHLDKTMQQQDWKRNYLVEQCLRTMFGLSSDYTLFELQQIIAGTEEFQDL
jgi:hypothetical protein